jgi:DNA repair exonuclease SbcCD ATPase subunit
MSSPLTVHVTNFQSIRQAVLSFSPGITVITGENNIGKSAIFRAIQTSLYNRPAEGYITRGMDKVSVEISYNDHTVLWERTRKAGGGESKVNYYIDGERYTKTGRACPDEVEQYLNLKELKVLGSQNAKAVPLNFWTQESLPFLMGYSPSQIFEFLSLSSEEGNLTSVVKVMKGELDDISSLVKTTEGQFQAFLQMSQQEEKKVAQFDGFESVYDRVIAFDSENIRYQKLSALTEKAQVLKVHVERCFRDVQNLSSYTSLQNRYISDLEGRVKEYLLLNQMIGKVEIHLPLVESSKEGIQRIAPIAGIPIESLEKRVRDVEKLQGEEYLLRQTIKKIYSLGNVVKSNRQEVTGIRKLLSSINLPLLQKSLQEYLDLGKLYMTVVKSSQSVDKGQGEVGGVVSTISSLNEELAEFSLCPLCEQPLLQTHCKEGK